MAIPERLIEEGLRRGAKARGGVAWKFVVPGVRGVPDRLVLLPGRRLGFVELKRPGETPRRLQTFVHRLLDRLGWGVTVLDSVESVEGYLNALENSR